MVTLVGARLALIKSVVQSLRDDFKGSALKPSVWPTRTDSGGNLVVSGGRLYVNGGSGAWGDPGIWRKAVARAAFGGVVAQVRITGASGRGPLAGWSNSTAPTLPGGARGLYYDYPQFKNPAGGTVSKGGTRARSIDYQMTAIPRVGGGYWAFLSGGDYGTWPSGTLLWIDDTEAFDPVYPSLVSKDGAYSVDFYQVLRPGQLPAAFSTRYGPATAADTFTATNGTALTSHNTEVGNFAWTQRAGTTATISNNIVSCAGTGTLGAYVNHGINPSTTPVIYECSITTPATGTIWGALNFRISPGVDSCYMAMLDDRFRVVGPSGILAESGTFKPDPSTTYRLQVWDWGPYLRVFINGEDVYTGSAIAITDLPTATYAGFFRLQSSGDNGCTFDNFAVYPMVQSLPSSVRVPSVPVGTGAATITDAFTAADSTAITTYNAAWSTPQGTWEINTNKARMTTAAVAGIAVRETSLTDLEVSCDVTTPNTSPTTTDWFCGILARYSDLGNYVYARFLYQNNSPEIEVWQVVTTTGGLASFTQFGVPSDILFTANTTYTLKLALVGAEFAVYVNGKLIGQNTLTASVGTKAGIGVFDSTAQLSGQPSFDNFAVKPAA